MAKPRRIERPDPYGDVLQPPFHTNGPRVAWFIENYCCYSDGVLMGRKRVLGRWQRWVLNEMFRLDPETNYTTRYWREFAELVPRGNDKSGLISALGYFFLVYDGEGAPEIYSAAKNTEQAGAVFTPAKIMHDFSPNLQAVCEKFATAITCPSTLGTWKPVSRIADTQQGKKPYVLLNDEYHVHESRDLRDTLIRGMSKRVQPLAIDITTEGRSRYSPLGELQQGYYSAIEAGNGTHTSLHDYLHVYKTGRSCLIRYGVPWGEADNVDPEDPAVVAACNPGEWIDPRRLIAEQLHRPGSRPQDFITYHMNGLVENAGGEGVPPDMWDACADSTAPPLQPGQDVVIAVDAGYRKDCSAVITAGRLPDGRARFDAVIWRPAREQGLELDLEATVEQYVNEQLERYRVSRIVCDPMLMNQSMQRWQQRLGSERVREYRFQWGDTGPDSVTLLSAIQGRIIVHDGDPTYRRHVLNMRTRYGPNGAWRWDDHPDKKRDDSDVPNDAGIASMMAAGELLGGEQPSLYGSRGLLIV